MSAVQQASLIQIVGAAGFGALIGWYVYYINRYRKEAVKLSDLATLIGVIGGGSVLALFPASTDLFGAYGIGLAIGFFGYFIALNVYVKHTENFSVDWFLDGRRQKPVDPWYIPEGANPPAAGAPMEGQHPMGAGEERDESKKSKDNRG